MQNIEISKIAVRLTANKIRLTQKKISQNLYLTELIIGTLPKLSKKLSLKENGAVKSKKLFPETIIHKIFETNSGH